MEAGKTQLPVQKGVRKFKETEQNLMNDKMRS